MTQPEKTLEQSDKIISGPISRTVITLALPVVLGMLMEFALSLTDYYWVSKLGPTAQDAVTSSMVVMWTMFAMISVVSIGVTALVARYVGANDLSRVAFYIKQGMALALLLGGTFAICGYLLAPALLKFMDTGPRTLVLAIPYLRIFFVSAVFFFWQDTIYATFRASGNPRTPTLVGVGAVVLNMILDPILIFGFGPVPALGVPGASIATAISLLMAATVITTLMLRGKLGYRVEQAFVLRPQLGSMLKIARIGIPMASQQFVFVVVYWFLIKVVHAFGENAAAAMGIGNRMESLSYLTCYGFSAQRKLL